MNMPKTVCLAFSIASSFESITVTGNARLRKRDRDAGSHRARADDAGLFDPSPSDVVRLRCDGSEPRRFEARARRRTHDAAPPTAPNARALRTDALHARGRTRTASRRRLRPRRSACARRIRRSSSGGTILCACETMNGAALSAMPLPMHALALRDAALTAALAREIDRDIEQIASTTLIDDALFLGLVHLDVAALEHHVERVLRADQTRQTLRAAGTGQQAQLDLGQTDLRVLERDAIVAGERRVRDRRRARSFRSRRRRSCRSSRRPRSRRESSWFRPSARC